MEQVLHSKPSLVLWQQLANTEEIRVAHLKPVSFKNTF